MKIIITSVGQRYFNVWHGYVYNWLQEIILSKLNEYCQDIPDNERINIICITHLAGRFNHCFLDAVVDIDANRKYPTDLNFYYNKPKNTCEHRYIIINPFFTKYQCLNTNISKLQNAHVVDVDKIPEYQVPDSLPGLYSPAKYKMANQYILDYMNLSPDKKLCLVYYTGISQRINHYLNELKDSSVDIIYCPTNDDGILRESYEIHNKIYSRKKSTDIDVPF